MIFQSSITIYNTIRMGVRAGVRICVYVYLCNGEGGVGRGGGIVRAFVYMHVTMDVRIY